MRQKRMEMKLWKRRNLGDVPSKLGESIIISLIVQNFAIKIIFHKL